jgi:ABC-2 type transport system permease protein
MKILAMMWKDILLRFSSRIELLFFLILPMVFTFLLSGVGGNQAEDVSLFLVVDDDQSYFSESLLKDIQEKRKGDMELVTTQEAEKRFEDQDVLFWIKIPAGFGNALIEGGSAEVSVYKTPNNISANAGESSIRAGMSTFGQALTIARRSQEIASQVQPFQTDSEKQTYFRRSLEKARESLAAMPPRLLKKYVLINEVEEIDSAAQASAGQLVSWVMIPLVGTSALLAWDRTGKTLARFLTTPTRTSSYILGTASGQLTISLFQMLILMAFGALVLKLPWGKSPLGLAMVMVSFGLAAVASGMMLGAFVKSSRAANSLSIMISMLFALLGGCWWPLELFPPLMRKLAQIFPTYWAMQGFTTLLSRGGTYQDIIPHTLVLLAFAVVFFTIGILFFRYE